MGKRFVSAAVMAAFLLATPVHAETKREVIVELLEMSGAKQLSIQMIERIVPQIMDIIRRSNPNIPDNYLTVADEELRAVFVENIDDAFEPAIIIYAQEFTLEELQALKEFQASPLGQKAISVAPRVMQQLSIAGEAWGRAMAPIAMERVKKRLKTEGYELEL